MKNLNSYILVDSIKKQISTITIEGYLSDPSNEKVSKLMGVKNISQRRMAGNYNFFFCNNHVNEGGDKIKSTFEYNGCYTLPNKAIIFSFDENLNRVAPIVTLKEAEKLFKFKTNKTKNHV